MTSNRGKLDKRLPSLRARIIALCFGSSVGLIVLCVGILFQLLFSVLGDYTQQEADFALKEINGDLTTKTSLLADMLLNVRRDETLMQALKEGGFKQNLSGESLTEESFRHAVDIYSNKNTDKLKTPFLDAAYLFDKDGSFHKTSYTEHLYHMEKAIDEKYEGLYSNFIDMKTDVAIISDENHLHIFYILYDDIINPCGTLVFSVRKEAITHIMGKTKDYPASFWIVYDKNGNPLLHDGVIEVSRLDIRSFVRQPFLDPIQQNLPQGEYRIYSGGVTMGIGAVLGVSANQLQLLLLRSIRMYIIGILVALTVVGGLIFWAAVHLTKPLPEMAGKLQQVARGHFDTKLPGYSSREFNTISTTFNSMTETINHLIHDVYEKKLMIMDSEMKFVQSQMNPHFMYNVLNTIALQAQIDGNEDVHKMASNFASLMQARLNWNGDGVITIGQELQYVRFYLELQKSRFGEKLTHCIHVEDESLLSYTIPKLTVELIVENAVLHGIEAKDDSGYVDITVKPLGENIRITVKDNGVGFKGACGEVPLPLPTASFGNGERHNHIALNNASKIIRHHYGEEYGIGIVSHEGQGATVTVTIPQCKEDRNVSDYHCG